MQLNLLNIFFCVGILDNFWLCFLIIFYIVCQFFLNLELEVVVFLYVQGDLMLRQESWFKMGVGGLGCMMEVIQDIVQVKFSFL